MWFLIGLGPARFCCGSAGLGAALVGAEPHAAGRGLPAVWSRLVPPRAGDGEPAARMRFRRAVVVRSRPGALRYAEPPRPASPMAKRRAEPLVCYAPFKRLLREPPPPPRSSLSERRPRNEAAGAGAAAKRKLEEAEAPPGKRPGLRGGGPRGELSDAAGRRRRRGEPAAPHDGRTAEGSDGRRGEEPAAAPVTTRRAGRGGAGG